MIFGPERTFSIGSAVGYAVCADEGNRVWRAWCDAGVVKVAASVDQGISYGAAVNVDSTAGNKEVMLNEVFTFDLLTNTLHLLWERDSDSGTLAAKLVYARSTDFGATWSTPIVLDDGTVHTNGGVARFYRCGMAAYNGVVGVAYATIDSSVFTTDKLWFVGSANGGVTWSAPAQKFAATVALAGEPNAEIGDDGSMHVSWYDNGTNINGGGDLYYARLDWNAAGFVWPGASTRVTTGQVCGRTRVTTSRGVVILITNSNWGGSAADVATVRSTDNGATWGSLTTQATHTTDSLDHPWCSLRGKKAVIVWVDFATTPRSYGCLVSNDAGATWTTLPAPLTPQVNSDAPRMVVTKDLFVLFGAGNVSGQRYTVLPAFAPDPASTAVAFVDQFNRADENPLSDGGKWSQDVAIGGGGACRVVSNQVTRQGAAGGFARSGSYRNDRTSSTNYEVFGTVGAGGGEIDLGIADESTKNGYSVANSGGDFGTSFAVSKMNAGTPATIGDGDTSRALTATDKFLLRLTPGFVVAYRCEGSNWREITRAPDTAYRGTTMRGIIDIAGQAGTPALDDFGDTALANPSSTAAPVASGTVLVGQTLSVTDGTWATANGATPTRYSYQWQSSPAGAGTWTNITRATLPWYVVADATKDYRCVVTADNTLAAVSANSNALTAGSASLVEEGYMPGTPPSPGPCVIVYS